MGKAVKINPEELSDNAIVDKYKPNLKRFDKAKKMIGLVVGEMKKFEVILSDESQVSAMDMLKIASSVEKAIEKKRKDQVAPWNDGVAQINSYVKDLVKDLKPGIETVKKAVLSYQQEQERKAIALRTETRKNTLLELGYENDENTLFKHDVDGVITIAEIENYNDIHWDKVLEQAAQRISESVAALQEKNEEAEELSALFSDQHEDLIKPTPAPAVATFAPSHSIPIPAKLKGTTRRWTFQVTDGSIVPKEYLKVDEVAIREAVNKGIRDIPGVRIYQDTSLSIR
ncbi:MAG: hypothetical protein KF862_07370 [Chitinophagaceae bacterium]|nr:hypothetical protein [Chitinophagaceae bacterium]